MLYNFLITLSDVSGFWPYLSSHDESDFGIMLRFGNFEIRWYAICILFGAFLCLLRCRYELKKKGLPSDYYDNFFLSVIPISIIGARVWYVISSPGEFSNFAEMIGFQNGSFQLSGLAVQGGVLAGVLWGAIYFTKIKKRYPFGLHVDLVVPSILIGQVLGRWGNFFNGEVYGKVVDRDTLWYIPRFIINNCTTGGVLGSQAGQQNVVVPLFYVESCLNIIGYVLIGYVIWRFWKKFRKPYEVGCLYFIWYGTVRLILEPLRDPRFIMKTEFFGVEVQTSIMMSIIYIAIGIIGIIVTQIVYRKVPFEKIYVNEAADKLEAEQKALKEKELQDKIDAKKAEIRARKEKEKNSGEQNEQQ